MYGTRAKFTKPSFINTEHANNTVHYHELGESFK